MNRVYCACGRRNKVTFLLTAQLCTQSPVRKKQIQRYAVKRLPRLGYVK
jgi:hypothetical protein